jgi:hypothetical protein
MFAGIEKNDENPSGYQVFRQRFENRPRLFVEFDKDKQQVK